ncbi:S-layer homology domain-containing protein [Paenibacillus sp. GSMTC-2017]|uniref:S-layer homology domain-containing protein n=1 Tax=Paenibacillus sp. GSMTC-2017 TaxID=2794350 RepID=UPI0018D8E9C0|nr:S-layer homology domain-containing protein [Paenibacillus sp. GSMTC-2017]MBH5320143.1 S-layer homology domain-containing protein [Paenibacillus sp. GSMTC-2017]
MLKKITVYILAITLLFQTEITFASSDIIQEDVSIVWNITEDQLKGKLYYERENSSFGLGDGGVPFVNKDGFTYLITNGNEKRGDVTTNKLTILNPKGKISWEKRFSSGELLSNRIWLDDLGDFYFITRSQKDRNLFKLNKWSASGKEKWSVKLPQTKKIHFDMTLTKNHEIIIDSGTNFILYDTDGKIIGQKNLSKLDNNFQSFFTSGQGLFVFSSINLNDNTAKLHVYKKDLKKQISEFPVDRYFSSPSITFSHPSSVFTNGDLLILSNDFTNNKVNACRVTISGKKLWCKNIIPIKHPGFTSPDDLSMFLSGDKLYQDNKGTRFLEWDVRTGKIVNDYSTTRVVKQMSADYHIGSLKRQLLSSRSLLIPLTRNDMSLEVDKLIYETSMIHLVVIDPETFQVVWKSEDKTGDPLVSLIDRELNASRFSHIFGAGGGKVFIYYTDKTTDKRGLALVRIHNFDTLTHWARKDIKSIYEKKIISGFEDGSFRPDDPISMEQFITMLVRASDHVMNKPQQTQPLGDNERWSSQYIATAKSNGWLNEVQLQNYSLALQRNELALLLSKVLGNSMQTIDNEIPNSVFFEDIDTSTLYQQEIYEVVSARLISGYADKTFRPNQYVTRAQAVTVLNKLLQFQLFDQHVNIN